MKVLKPLSVFLVIMVLSMYSQAQTDCKVLVPMLEGSYIGKCKKGLAHGKGVAKGLDTYEGNFKKGLPNGNGIYTWASGAQYNGEWVDGERDGEGIYTFKYGEVDSLVFGIWKDDKYMGPLPLKPTVSYKEFVTRYNFRRVGEGDRVLIDLWINGNPNIDIEDFSIIYTSGSDFRMGRSYGVETIDFPVMIKISYISWNVMHSSQHSVIFEFEITEPGNWQVDVTN